MPFAREIWIEADDFAEMPPAGWQRLVPGGEVRLRYSYVMRCDEVGQGCGRQGRSNCAARIDHDTLGKNPQGRKVKGVIHLVSAEHALPAEIRLYDRLFTVPEPDGDKEADFCEFINPRFADRGAGLGRAVRARCRAGNALPVRASRLFLHRPPRSPPGEKLVFNRTVTLKDSWTK